MFSGKSWIPKKAWKEYYIHKNINYLHKNIIYTKTAQTGLFIDGFIEISSSDFSSSRMETQFGIFIQKVMLEP